MGTKIEDCPPYGTHSCRFAPFVAWNTNKFAAESAWTRGDFNADGVVDGIDIIPWNANKFQTSDSITASTGTQPQQVDDEDQSPLATLHQLVDNIFAEAGV